MLTKRLRLLRDKIDFTQEELAEALKVKRSTLANWEIGVNEPTIDMLIEIANYFDVSIDYLVGNDQTINVSKQK